MSIRKSISGRSSNSKWGTVAVVVILLISIGLFIIIKNPNLIPELELPGITHETYTYDELVEYALILINNDRKDFGLENVTLSEIKSAQQHVEVMFQHSFLSHWDINGLKPYMRYTLSGGEGSVAENVAWLTSTGYIDPKESLKELEWQMMYNDSDSDWGHKENILTAIHNKVSIGIAYDNNNVYFVQDFENEYVNWEVLTVSGNVVDLKGTILYDAISIEQVAIYYDNLPSPLTKDQLEKPPFNGSYDQGNYVASVLPSGWKVTDGITITSDVWVQTANSFEFKFNLSEVINVYGEGVYTLYFVSDVENHILLSYSIWT